MKFVLLFIRVVAVYLRRDVHKKLRPVSRSKERQKNGKEDDDDEDE